MTADQKQSESGVARALLTAVSVIMLMLCSAVAAVFIYRVHSPACNVKFASQHRQLHFAKETPVWDEVGRLNIHEKNVTVIRTEGSNRCYVAPLNEHNEQRVYSLLHEPLTDELLEELAGPYAVLFCDSADTYLVREIAALERSREKRQAAGGGSAPVRASGLTLEYDERDPRCMDLILDCTKEDISEVQTCYTWVNGVIKMDQKCEAPNKFTIYMSKPPGRILKIAVQQWKICVARRKEGLRC